MPMYQKNEVSVNEELKRIVYPKSEDNRCVNCKAILHVAIYYNSGWNLKRTFFKVDDCGNLILPQQKANLVKCPLCYAKQSTACYESMEEYIEAIAPLMLHSLDEDGWHKEFIACASADDFFKTDHVKKMLQERW